MHGTSELLDLGALAQHSEPKKETVTPTQVPRRNRPLCSEPGRLQRADEDNNELIGMRDTTDRSKCTGKGRGKSDRKGKRKTSGNKPRVLPRRVNLGLAQRSQNLLAESIQLRTRSGQQHPACGLLTLIEDQILRMTKLYSHGFSCLTSHKHVMCNGHRRWACTRTLHGQNKGIPATPGPSFPTDAWRAIMTAERPLPPTSSSSDKNARVAWACLRVARTWSRTSVTQQRKRSHLKLGPSRRLPTLGIHTRHVTRLAYGVPTCCSRLLEQAFQVRWALGHPRAVPNILGTQGKIRWPELWGARSAAWCCEWRGV